MSAAVAAAKVKGFFASRDGLQLYHEVYPAPTPARATLLFVHGYSDHAGRYRWPAAHLSAAGFDCVLFDYRGHGQAAGARGHCYHFEEFLGDLDAALELAAARAAGRPLFLIAHSHGALIAIRYLLAHPAPTHALSGLCLSSPYLGLKLKVPAGKRLLARLLSRTTPRLTLRQTVPPEDLSHEAEIVTTYLSDRFVHKVATARWYTEALAAQRYCLEHAEELRVPLLVLAGGDERVVDPAAIRRLFESASSKDKRLIVYPGLFHEVFNETERERVFADVAQWIGARL